jgi:hypothetical protein
MGMSRYGVSFLSWKLKNLAKSSFGTLHVHNCFHPMILTLPKTINRASVLDQFMVSSFVISHAITWRSICSDTMAFALSKFISVPSISGIPTHREDCRQAAIWLRKCLGQLGARTSLVSLNENYPSLFDVVQLPTGEGNNPLVLATFEGSIDAKPKPRILFYGYGFFCVAPFPS